MEEEGKVRSRVYTDRPSYADFDAPHKFEAIKTIIAKRLIQHPKAICSYSGGSDSDILLDLIERTRKMFPQVQPVKYVFFNTGLEMQATKEHVKETAEKYGVEIEERNRRAHTAYRSFRRSCQMELANGKQKAFRCPSRKNMKWRMINRQSVVS